MQYIRARWGNSGIYARALFIPASEFGGETCELTCSIHQE